MSAALIVAEEKISSWLATRVKHVEVVWQQYMFQFFRKVGEEKYYNQVLLFLPADIAGIVRDYHICDMEMSYAPPEPGKDATTDDHYTFAHHFEIARKMSVNSVEENERIGKFLERGRALLHFIAGAKLVLTEITTGNAARALQKSMSHVPDFKVAEFLASPTMAKIMVAENLKDVLAEVHKFFWEFLEQDNGNMFKNIVNQEYHTNIDMLIAGLRNRDIKQIIITKIITPFINKFDLDDGMRSEDKLNLLADDLLYIRNVFKSPANVDRDIMSIMGYSIPA